MPDTKITALTAISTVDPAVDVLPIVDVSDTTMAASGTTKKITSNQILGAGGTATLASATITGAATVGTTLGVTSSLTVGTGANSAVQKGSILGGYTVFENSAGTGNPSITFNNDIDTGLLNPNANTIAFAIGGSEAMRLNSTGLGVGAGPSYQLHVAKSQSSQTTVFIDNQQNNAAASSALTLSAYGGQWNLSVPHSATFVNPLIFKFGSTEMMRIDSSGNVGVGVTPSAWISAVKGLQVGSYGSIGGSSSNINFLGNLYSSASGTAYLGNGFGTNLQMTSGQFVFYQAGNNTSGANALASLTQAMTLDASGNLLVGKTAVGPTTRGFEAVGATGIVNSTVANDTNSVATFAAYSTLAAAYRFYVGLAGTVFATNTTISAISDARLKENVQDLDVGLGAILALKPRKFDWKEGKGKNIKGDRGFIAQEFEQVFPQLVDEWKDNAPEGEAPYKSVRQDLIPVLVKAIQELTARVEALEA
jgi:hypothetical protein